MKGLLLAAAAAAVAAQNEPWANFTQTVSNYTGQLLDHFDLTNTVTWNQRYYTVQDFWKASPTGLVILYICGEYTCEGVTSSRNYPAKVAYDHNALIVTVEHRFYGESQPTGDLAVDSLRFLNSRQALADLAQFQAWFQETAINQVLGLPEGHTNPWLVIGGSYPGALSAWYRLKYPQNSIGALASSPVVNAIWDFSAFDAYVSSRVSPQCLSQLQGITAAVEAGLPGVKAQFKAPGFGDATTMDNGDFLFMVADSMAEGIQYGHKGLLCQAAAGGLPGYLNYTINYWGAVMGNGPAEYDRRVLGDPVNGGDGRSWQWQTCTEVGWWQTAPAHNSMRSAQVNMTYYADLCSAVFGLPAGWVPAVNATNEYYGGANIQAYNLILSNFQDDPWSRASVLNSPLNTLEVALESDFYQACHCNDLHSPLPSDPPALKVTRAKEAAYFELWLQQWLQQRAQ